MLICDAHCDTLYSLMAAPSRPVDVTLERLLEGGVAIQTMAMFVGPKAPLQEVEARFDRMYAAFLSLKDQGWPQAFDPSEAVRGTPKMMLSIEGCEVFERGISKIAEYRDKGLRIAAVTWNHENALATPAIINDHEGLKPFGLIAIREMQRLKIAVDVSHLNEAGFFDILHQTSVPPMASHSCCRALHDHWRNLTDLQLKELFQAGGFVGVNFYPGFLTGGPATIDDLVNHIDHMMQLGGEGKVGFGSDFDGIDRKPEGLDHPGDYPRLIAALRGRGYPEETINSIAGQAMIDYFARI